MRKDLNSWHFSAETENSERALCRFLIALDELRARMSPKYPNIEISDEGYLWFNIDTSEGIVEILAFPLGFREKILEPSLAASFPREAEQADLNLLKKICQIADDINGAKTLIGFSAKNETLEAYKQDRHPPLTLLLDLEKTLEMKKKDVFFSYLGVSFSIVEKNVSEVEQILKEILLRLKE